MRSKSRTTATRKSKTTFVPPTIKFYVFKQINSGKYAILHNGGVVFTLDVELATRFTEIWQAQIHARNYQHAPETKTLLLTPVF